MAGAKIVINDERVLNILKDVQDKVENAGPFMEAVSLHFLDSILANFDDEGRPKKWKELEDSTLKARKKGKGVGSPKILQASAAGLMASMTSDFDDDTAEAGTNKVYAAIHNFGGPVKTKFTAFEMPQREFIMIHDEDVEIIEGMAADFLMDNVS